MDGGGCVKGWVNNERGVGISKWVLGWGCFIVNLELLGFFVFVHVPLSGFWEEVLPWDCTEGEMVGRDG